MFERFTERARQVVVLAQDEARRLRHNYIGTEHLLLGLLREEEGLAARSLEALGVTIDDVRARVERIVGRRDELATGQIPFTPRAKKVLELALREATRMGHPHIGTEHILLGLNVEGEGVANRILDELGATPDLIRAKLAGAFGPGPPPDVRSETIWASAGFGSPSLREPVTLVVGAALFGSGLVAGWLIWG